MATLTSIEKENRVLIGRIDIKDDDEKIIEIIKKWETIGEEFLEKSKALNEQNFRWYKGDTTDDIAENKSDVVSNRLFLSIETQIPMITSKPAIPVVYDRKTSKSKSEGQKLEKLHQKMLLAIYEDYDLELQKKLEILLRQLNIYKIGFLKYGINDGKIYVDNVLPDRIYIDPYAKSIDCADFIGERIIKPVWEVVEQYPDKAAFIYEKNGGKENNGTKIVINEWWTDNYFFVTYEGELLYKGENPLFDYDGKTEIDDDGEEVKHKSSKNYFRKPKKPYLSLSVFNFGDELRDFTSCLEQGIPLQNDLNNRMQQISNNAEITADPYLMGRGISKDRINYFNENKRTGDAVSLDDGEDMTYTQPPTLPNYVLDSVRFLRDELDNIFGTHGSSRGERGASETATGREILRQGDEDRQALFGRSIERLLQKLYTAFSHLINVFYEEGDVIPYLGEKDGKKYIEYKSNYDGDGLEVKVLAGSTLPDDKLSIKAEAMQLVQLGKITDEELYRRLGWEDPKEAAADLKKEAARVQEAMQQGAANEEMNKQGAARGQQDFDNVMGQIGQLE